MDWLAQTRKVRRIELPSGVGRPASGVLGPDAGCRTPSGVRYPGRVPGTLYVRHDGRGANRDHTVKDHEPRDEGADLVNSQLKKRSHTSSSDTFRQFPIDEAKNQPSDRFRQFSIDDTSKPVYILVDSRKFKIYEIPITSMKSLASLSLSLIKSLP